MTVGGSTWAVLEEVRATCARAATVSPTVCSLRAAGVARAQAEIQTNSAMGVAATPPPRR